MVQASTTLRILSGLIPADSGEAKVCGVDWRKKKEKFVITLVLAENNPLPEDLRVMEYLNFRARLKGIRWSHKKKESNEYWIHVT